MPSDHFRFCSCLSIFPIWESVLSQTQTQDECVGIEAQENPYKWEYQIDRFSWNPHIQGVMGLTDPTEIPQSGSMGLTKI